MKRILLGALVVVALAIPAAAAADSCSNVSRAAPQCAATNSCPPDYTVGNWVWLPSINVPEDAWGFAPPGTSDSIQSGAPGQNGNYTNGQTSSLLGMSANCPPGNNPKRQTTNGIQSGCLS